MDAQGGCRNGLPAVGECIHDASLTLTETHVLNRATILLAVTTFVLGIFSGWWLARFVEIDKCLDGGGLWNRATARCEISVETPVSMDKCLKRGGRWDYTRDVCDPGATLGRRKSGDSASD